MLPCKVESCPNPNFTRHLCRKHYSRLVRTGTTELFNGNRASKPDLLQQRKRSQGVREAIKISRRAIKPWRFGIKLEGSKLPMYQTFEEGGS